MKITSKDYRFMGIAEGIASQSNHDRYLMGAVLTKGGRVISTGTNRRSGRPFFIKDNGKPGLHAEIDCLYWISKKVSSGSRIYISGRSAAGSYILSRPCSSCLEFLQRSGISKIYYHTAKTGDIFCEKV